MVPRLDIHPVQHKEGDFWGGGGGGGGGGGVLSVVPVATFFSQCWAYLTTG